MADKYFIEKLENEYRSYVIRMLKTHPKEYGKMSLEDMGVLYCADTYQVKDIYGNFVGFFSLRYWNEADFLEIVLADVWVVPSFRKNGVFNKMVEFAVDKIKTWRVNDIYKDRFLTINAEKTNPLACNIYNKKFQFHEYNKKQKLYWWVIYEQRTN